MADLAQRSERAKSAALLFFAFVGFIASLISVLTFFQSDNTSALRIEASINEFRVPLYAVGNLEYDDTARKLARDLRREGCKRVNVPGIETISLSELAGLPLKDGELEDALGCKDAIDVEYAARWAGIYSASYSTLYRYKIENTGDEVAREIRVAASDIIALQFNRGSKFIDKEKRQDGEFFELPDLNPRETVTVLIWSKNWHPSLDYIGRDDLPAVSYSGPRVDFEIFKPVSGLWYDVYDIYSDMPVILLAAFIIAIAFLICLFVVFIISIIDAIITGKPISSIFKTEQSDVPTKNDDQATV